MVPDIAKKLKAPVKRESHFRYQYTYSSEAGAESGEKPKKSVVIRKNWERKGPTDLIELLSREKESLWLREQRM